MIRRRLPSTAAKRHPTDGMSALDTLVWTVGNLRGTAVEPTDPTRTPSAVYQGPGSIDTMVRSTFRAGEWMKPCHGDCLLQLGLYRVATSACSSVNRADNSTPPA
jgi:hypothetical protein